MQHKINAIFLATYLNLKHGDARKNQIHSNPMKKKIVSFLTLPMLAGTASASISYFTFDSPGVAHGVNGATILTLAAPFSSTGTGTFGGYLKLLTNDPVVSGISTSSNSVMPQVGASQTSSITRAELMASATQLNGGGSFIPFVLDLNEPNTVDSFLSIETFRIYHASTGSLSATSLADFLSGGPTLVWDMDSAGEVTLLVDEDTSAGSGQGNMMIAVPSSNFNQTDGFYYVFAEMGLEGDLSTRDYGNKGGFEEIGLMTGFTNLNTTALRTVTPQTETQVVQQIQNIPEPSAVLSVVLAGLLGLRRRR